MPTRPEGPDHLPAVRGDGLPEGGLLPLPQRGGQPRGRQTQHRLRGRHRPLPRRQLRHHRRHQGQAGLHLGLHLPGRFRGGGQRAEVSIDETVWGRPGSD